MLIDKQILKKKWIEEEKAVFQGWDFSRIHDKVKHDKLKWDYSEIIRKYLKESDRLLDMGTGGGEFLLTLNHPHNLTCVTERYPPNYSLCVKNLEPLGIQVKQVFNDNLPFDDGMFDIVINCHESFDINEVKRILKPRGIFITQQVGGENDKELREALCPEGIDAFENHNLQHNSELIKNAGMDLIYEDEDFTAGYFFDVSAVVYFAKIIEWEFPEFSVESRFEELLKLNMQLTEKGFIKNCEHRFIITAKKP